MQLLIYKITHTHPLYIILETNERQQLYHNHYLNMHHLFTNTNYLHSLLIYTVFKIKQLQGNVHQHLQLQKRIILKSMQKRTNHQIEQVKMNRINNNNKNALVILLKVSHQHQLHSMISCIRSIRLNKRKRICKIILEEKKRLVKMQANKVNEWPSYLLMSIKIRIRIYFSNQQMRIIFNNKQLM